jgi:hypothetical protein
MPPAGLEPTILVSELLQTDALDRTATRIGYFKYYVMNIIKMK